MFCERCGAGVAEGARFCGRCGQPVAGSNQEITESEGQQSASKPFAASEAPMIPFTNYAQEAKDAWRRVGSPELAAAGILAVLGLLIALVGLIATLNASGFDLGKRHGLLWGYLAGVLALIAVGWFFAAGARFQTARSWPVARDRIAAYVLASAAALFAL